MKITVKEKAKRAEVIASQLTKNQLNELRIIANEIMQMQRDITDSIKEKGLYEVCGITCDSECCAQKHENNIFDVYYFVLAIVAFSDEVRQEVMETADCVNFSPRCLYLGDDGCRIAHDSRPYMCKIWFCGRRIEMMDIIKEYHERFTELYQRFKWAVEDNS